MSWGCVCMFDNPEAAVFCCWCKAPRPGSKNSQEPQGSPNGPSSSIYQEEARRTSPVAAAHEAWNTNTRGEQIRCLMWHCKCSFINPGTEVLCSWCEAPQPGHDEDGSLLEDHRASSVGIQGEEDVVAKTARSTGTLFERVKPENILKEELTATPEKK